MPIVVGMCFSIQMMATELVMLPTA
jgi:hypothetical protein